MRHELKMSETFNERYIEDIYIDDTIEDQKKYMDNVSDTVQMPERIYYTLENFNKQEENTPCQCKGASSCYHIYH